MNVSLFKRYNHGLIRILVRYTGYLTTFNITILAEPQQKHDSSCMVRSIRRSHARQPCNEEATSTAPYPHHRVKKKRHANGEQQAVLTFAANYCIRKQKRGLHI